MPGESSGCFREPEITLGFGFEPSLEFGMWVFGRAEQRLDAGERTARSCSASFDGFVCAVEIIPCKRLYVGPENQMRVALPNFKLMLLCGADGAADHLKDVGWSAAMSVFDAHRNGDDVLGTKIASRARWNLRDQSSIGEAASADFNGFEQAWESATSADCFAEIPVSENHGFTVGQIRCDYGHGNSKIFEATRFENLFDKVAQPVIAGESQARNAPAADVTKTNFAAGGDDSR